MPSTAASPAEWSISSPSPVATSFRGDVRVYYWGGGLNSENAPEGVEGIKKVDKDLDTSVNLGGPVIKDNLWYFVSGNARQVAVDAFYAEGAPDDDRAQERRTGIPPGRSASSPCRPTEPTSWWLSSTTRRRPGVSRSRRPDTRERF